jgi:hypothetical protein
MVKSELDVCWNLNDFAIVTGSHIRANPWNCLVLFRTPRFRALDSGP